MITLEHRKYCLGMLKLASTYLKNGVDDESAIEYLRSGLSELTDNLE